LDLLQQPQLQQAKHQAERHYHYDNNYLLTQVDDSRLGKLSYQYDPIGRLIKAQNPYSSESFSFDSAGNLIDPIATQTSQVKNNLITQYQGKHYKYDAQGNVIETSQSGQTLKLTWDNLNRLIQSDHNGQITSYGYDVFGRRIFKKNTTEDSLTLFGWDGDLMIWESQRSNKEKENYTKHYVYEPDSFVPLLQTGYTRFIQLIETPDYRQFQDVPYSIYKDPVWKTDTQKNKAELERVAFYHCDQVGTPQTLSNELGECIWEIKQDTWGTALEIKATEEDNPFGHSNIRFQGQYYDKETGLHYNRYRYYEPYSARYVSKDPIGLFGGLNNSVYVSDPNQWVDPLGLMEIFSSAECTYKISAQNLKCTKIITSLGTTGIEREHQSIEFTKDDGIFSGRFECKDNSSQRCLDTKDIGPPLPGTYDMKRVDKYGGSWWLDEGIINRRLRNRGEFYLHEGSISHGCITVNKMNDSGTSKFFKLKRLFEGTSPKMIIEK
ncbi:RHS domain-containing protein, partial [Acinetobacter bereziniae]|uniref:RHS repeat-associated core domain-containing protein n=1 Tax=Acinetobacter bereziniae TaxID=106648 RepID=UPI0021CD2754